MRYWTLGACAVASILTGAARLYVHLATENRSHVKLLLRDAASARADLIRAHVVERLADAALFAQHGEVAGAVSPAESSAAVVAVARRTLMQTLEAYHYRAIDLVDAQGRVVVGVGAASLSTEAREGVDEAMRARRGVLVPARRSADGSFGYGVASPIFAGGDEARGAVQGAVYLAMDARTVLFPMLAEGRATSRSYEAMLLQRGSSDVEVLISGGESVTDRPAEGVAVTRLRALAPQTLDRGDPATLEGSDGRGVAFLGGVAAVPGSPWLVLARVGRDEADAPMRSMLEVIVPTAMLLVALVSALGRVLWRDRRKADALHRAALAQRAQRVVEASMDGYTVIDDGRVVEVNRALTEMLGLPAEALLGRLVTDLRIDASPDLTRAVADTVRRNGQYRFYTAWKHATGRPVEFEVSAVSFGSDTASAAFLRDITEVTRTERAAEQQRRLASLLNHSSEALFAARTPDEAFASVCRIASEDGAFRLAWSMLGDETTGSVRPMARSGPAIGYLDAIHPTFEPGAEARSGPTWQSIRQRRTVVVDDFLHDPMMAPWFDAAKEYGLASLIALPLLVDDRALGALVLYAATPDYFDAEIVALLEHIARLLSLVLRAFERESQRAEALRAVERSESRFQSLFDNSPLPTLVFDAHLGALRNTNRAFKQAFGYESIVRPTLDEAFAMFYPDPAYRARILEVFMEDVHRSGPVGTSRSPELVVRGRDGKERVVVGYLTRVGDEYMIGFVDLSELRATQALATEAQKIAKLEPWEYDFGAGRTARDLPMLAGTGLFDETAEASEGGTQTRLRAAFLRAVERREPFDELAEVRDSRGHARWMRLRARIEYAADGSPHRAIGSVQDVTDETVAAQELARHRNHLAELVDERTAELARANATLQRADRRLKTMLSLSQRASGLEEKEIVQLCIDEAVALSDSRVGFLYFIDEAAGVATLGAWSSSAHESHEVGTPERCDLATAGAWADAARRREPVLRNDLGGTHGHAPLQRALTVPLLENGRVVVLLGVADKAVNYVDGDVQELGLVAHDVWSLVQRRRAELALAEAFLHLRASDQRFAYAMEASVEGVWDWDLVGNNAYYNDAYIRTLGGDPATFPQTFEAGMTHIHPDDQNFVASETQRQLRVFGASSIEFRTILPTGESRWVVSRSKVVERDADGVPTRIVGTVQDQTERRAAEEKLFEAMQQANAASEAKSAFLATMSHEIRTPLNGVVGMAEILSQSALGPRDMEAVRTIQSSGRALLSVIDEILDFSKIEAGRLELEDSDCVLADLIEDVRSTLAPVATAKNVDLVVMIAPDLPQAVRCDVVRVRQVLFNLLGNAIKFGAGRDGRRGNVELVAARAGDLEDPSLTFTVRDDGIGMDDATQRRLFASFMQAEASTTRRFGGTGLGLAITKRLVEMMQGAIAVTSAPGEGSCFLVTLPLHHALSEPARWAPPEPVMRTEVASPPSVDDARARGELVLVAEDDAINQKVILRQLELLGYLAEVAMNGVEALRMWRTGRYALLLTDLHMPEMDGYTLTREIRGAEGPGPRMPIIALTANALRGEVQKAFDAGMDAYLTKPVPLAVLQSTMRRWTRGSGEHRSGSGEYAATRWRSGQEPAPAAGGARAIDVAVLRSLVGDDESVVRDFLGEFRDDALRHAAALRAACDAGDLTEAARLVHKLKSSSRSVGALPLADASAELERFAKAGDTVNVGRERLRLDACLEAVLAALDPMLK